MNFTINKTGFQASIGLLGLLCARSLFADAKPLSLVPIAHCRVVDTRTVNGDLGAPDLLAGTRDFPILAGDCGIPDSAVAYSINVTAAPVGHLSYLSVYPTGQDQPQTPTLNAENGRFVANAVMVAAGTNGSIEVYTTDETDLILDVNGYYLPAPPPAGARNATAGTAAATAASGSAALKSQGTWSALNMYALHDVVDYNGSSYISLVADNTSHEPDTSTSEWSLLNRQGETGSATGATELTLEFTRNDSANYLMNFVAAQKATGAADTTAPQVDAGPSVEARANVATETGARQFSPLLANRPSSALPTPQ